MESNTTKDLEVTNIILEGRKISMSLHIQIAHAWLLLEKEKQVLNN